MRRRGPAPDLVERQFSAAGPDRLWVADITYVPTWAGVLYLAVVLDAWSRRIIGWAMEAHLRTELVVAPHPRSPLRRGGLDAYLHGRRDSSLDHSLSESRDLASDYLTP